MAIAAPIACCLFARCLLRWRSLTALARLALIDGVGALARSLALAWLGALSRVAARCLGVVAALLHRCRLAWLDGSMAGMARWALPDPMTNHH